MLHLSLPSRNATIAGISVLTCLALGGGSRQSLLSDSILQAICVPLLMIAAFSLSDSLSSRSRRSLYLALALIAALFVLQLLPLPGVISASFRLSAESAAIAGAAPSNAATAARHMTLQSLASLLPPLTVFVAVVNTTIRDRASMTIVIIVAALAMSALGLMQLAEGPASSLRFYDITNETEAVGMFANRNHFSAFLNVSFILVGVWVFVLAARDSGTGSGHGRDNSKPLRIAALIVCALTLVTAQLLARSRAGIIFMTLIFIVFLSVLWRLDRRNSAPSLGKAIIGVVVFGVVFALDTGWFRFAERWSVNTLQDARVIYGKNTLTAAQAFLPFGSGIGTFPTVYGTFAPGRDEFQSYANRAHNDFLELFLETGFVGVAVLVVAIGWSAFMFLASWRSRDRNTSSATPDIMNSLLPVAGLFILLVLIGQSLLDYPLRTAANMAMFAMSAALLTPPLASVAGSTTGRQRERPGRKQGPSAPSSETPTKPLSYGQSFGAEPAGANDGSVWPTSPANSKPTREPKATSADKVGT